MNPVSHSWFVYSTASEDRCLLVEDRNTGQRGYIPDPTKAEWEAAYHAPSNPYPWKDASRVIVDNETAAPFTEEMKEAVLEMVQHRCQGT